MLFLLQGSDQRVFVQVFTLTILTNLILKDSLIENCNKFTIFGTNFRG